MKKLLLLFVAAICAISVHAADPDLANDYTLVRRANFNDGTSLAGTETFAHKVWAAGSYLELTILTSPEDAAGWIALYPGGLNDGNGWNNRFDGEGKIGLWNRNSKNRPGAVFGDDLATGWLVVFECTQTASKVIALTDGNGDPNGTFTYTASDDGNTYYCTVTASSDAYVGFNGISKSGYISAISVYKPKKEVESANYTINYLDTNLQPLQAPSQKSGIVGSPIVLESSDKEPLWNDGQKYFYQSDNSADLTVASDGSTQVNIIFRPAKVFTYTIVNNFDEVISSGKDFEGEKVQDPYPRYKLQGSTLYEADKTQGAYKTSFELSEDNIMQIVTYEKACEGVVFYTEAEDVEGVVLSDASLPIISNRSSNGMAAYVKEGEVLVTHLNPGKYIFHVGYSVTTDSSIGKNMNLGVGDATFEIPITNIGGALEAVSDEYALNAVTPVRFLASSGHFDYLWIEKTGDVTPAIEGTLRVCGTDVTGENAADILGNGAFSYDVPTKTLHVKGDYNYEGNYLIHNWDIAGLTIAIDKDVTLRCTDNPDFAFWLWESATITGPGKLTLYGNISVINGSCLTFDGANVELQQSTSKALIGNLDGESLVVKNSTIHAQAYYWGICDFTGGITLEDCTLADGLRLSDDSSGIVTTLGSEAADATITAKADGIKGIGNAHSVAKHKVMTRDGILVRTPDGKEFRLTGVEVK